MRAVLALNELPLATEKMAGILTKSIAMVLTMAIILPELFFANGGKRGALVVAFVMIVIL
ncbi:MAG: hypothetical protein B6I36_05540 [Desulfobacteraceae bacterium 4572_35.1]|nr:MAG: hypothetical protein B6I36_05540 [Desulfobacteraceae bacterium 4572_35.1]